ARDIFSKYGFKKTTMDDIAHASRKGKSSIYYYFRNKEEIFQAVVEKEIIVLRSKIFLAMSESDDVKRKLKAYILTRMTGFEDMINFYNAIKNEYLTQFEFIEHIRYKYDKEEIGIIQQILDEGVKNGTFSIEDTNLAAIAVCTAMKGFEIPFFVFGNEDSSIEMRLDKLLEMLFNGILKH
ncbi:MAG: TetR/AcrR family transcriptional regulator, partial [Bacteroidota bacterium]|nr:TetR/AcrR family transcriptional regulator [Bacteroidota bacterium]